MSGGQSSKVFHLSSMIAEDLFRMAVQARAGFVLSFILSFDSFSIVSQNFEPH